MAIAVFLVWRRGFGEKGVRPAFVKFWVQLVLNALWSVVFFGFRSPIGGVVVVIILWILILFTIIRFFKVTQLAGWLLIPYILWVSIASYLNVGVWVLNP